MFFVSDQPPGEGGRMPAGARGPFPLGGGPMGGGAMPWEDFGEMFGDRNLYVPDPSITPPDAVQALIDGEEGAVCCGHCRKPGATLRCGRCKCVKYCNVDCQRSAFGLHKKSCKAIRRHKDSIDTLLAQCADIASNFTAVDEMTKLADLLIKVGYQESDTVANGRIYYQEALKYFVMPMICYKHHYHMALASTKEDKVLLLIAALGGGDRAIKAWCEETEIKGENDRAFKSPRWAHFESVSGDAYVASDKAEAEALGVSLYGLVHDDIPFHVIRLFNLMKALAEHRENMKRLSVLEDEMAKEVALNNVLPYMESHGAQSEEGLAEEIQSVLRVIRHFGNESYIVALKESIPLQEEDAPKLFRLDPDSFVGRKCLWMILQDLFFETPGVRNMLDEFLPEE